LSSYFPWVSQLIAHFSSLLLQAKHSTLLVLILIILSNYLLIAHFPQVSPLESKMATAAALANSQLQLKE